MKYMAHFMLMLFFVGLGSVSCKQAQESDSSMVTPEELASKEGDIILIDVRTPAEYVSGHIENSVNINFYDQKFKNKLEKIDKTKEVYVYCKVGGRSAKAADMMKEMGFEHVYDLQGGIRNWKKSGLNTVK